MRYPWLALAGVLWLCSCRPNVSLVDREIDAGIRASMDTLNSQVLDGVGKHNPALIQKVSSDSLWTKDGQAINDQVRHNTKSFDPTHFKVRNQFYLYHTGSDSVTTVRRFKGSEHDYIVTLQPQSAETAVTFGYYNAIPETFALTTAYGRHDGEWKLDVFQLGLLKIMNGDAIDWYHKAQQDFDQGYLADAGNDLLLCEELLRPAGNYIRYVKEKEINDLDLKLTSVITHRYPLPLTDSLVRTRPRIFKISLHRTDEGYFPFILYNTHLDLTDSAALSKECNAVCAHLGDLFKGLDQDKRFLFFRAYRDLPGDDTADGVYREFRREGRPPVGDTTAPAQSASNFR